MADPKDDGGEVAMGPEVSPGTRVAVVRRGGETSVVCMSRSEEGRAIRPGEELVSLGPPTCDCGHVRSFVTLHREGPAQVASEAYREGYDRIFGKRQVVGSA